VHPLAEERCLVTRILQIADLSLTSPLASFGTIRGVAGSGFFEIIGASISRPSVTPYAWSSSEPPSRFASKEN
jgi:hypothetical protein